MAVAAETPLDCWTRYHLSYYGSIVSFYRFHPWMGLVGEVVSFTGWIGMNASCLGSWNYFLSLAGSPFASDQDRRTHLAVPSATFSTDFASRNSNHLNSYSANDSWYYLLASCCWGFLAFNLGTAELMACFACSSRHSNRRSLRPTQIGEQACHNFC